MVEKRASFKTFVSSDKDNADLSDTNTNRPKKKGIPDLPYNFYKFEITSNIQGGFGFFFKDIRSNFFQGHRGLNRPTVVGITYQIWK
jgi:hypothetical protein